MPLRFKIMLLCIVLLGCGAQPEQPAASTSVAQQREPGEVFGLQRQDALRRLEGQEMGIFDPQQSCDANLRCVATRFHGCCADYFGSDCDWVAVNEVWLERETASCAEQECPEGPSPCLQSTSAEAPEAYCAVYETPNDMVFAMCRLR